ncbi:nucleotide disphospho-sugar-binding domain-containing protein [Williamsia sp. MIQD14]|uniref:nucleotide disphospho-sugar-binding domain-containing protein n=1 Tax=Williamsia sp. MIQD14 TaxID=3425703 RepID=UPI003DA0EACE
MTSPARGVMYPIVETLLELCDRGHDIRVITLADEVAMLRGLGLSASPLPAEIDAALPGDWRGDGTRTPGALTDRLLGRIDAEFAHLTSVIADHRPDMILTDVVATGAQCAAEASGLPWAIFSATFLPLFSTDGPPIGLGLTPREGRLAHMRDTAIAHAAQSLWDLTFLRKFNRARTRYGLSPLRHCDEVLRRAPLLLSLCGAPLERARTDWPPTVEMVGPSLWAPPGDRDPRIDAITAPIALVTCSTELQADETLAATALEALAGTGLHAVVTTGALDPDRFVAGRDSTVARFLPHEQVLARTSVVISHGGMGITHKALARGIPMVVVPFGRDQRDIAARVAAAGCGVRLDPRRMTATSLRTAVSTALDRSDRARCVADLVPAEGSAERAAAYMEKILVNGAGGGTKGFDPI